MSNACDTDSLFQVLLTDEQITSWTPLCKLGEKDDCIPSSLNFMGIIDRRTAMTESMFAPKKGYSLEYFISKLEKKIKHKFFVRETPLINLSKLCEFIFHGNATLLGIKSLHKDHGHMTVIAKSLNGTIYFFDPQSSEVTIGEENIKKILNKNKINNLYYWCSNQYNKRTFAETQNIIKKSSSTRATKRLRTNPIFEASAYGRRKRKIPTKKRRYKNKKK